MQALSTEEIERRRSAQLPTWTYESGHLTRTYHTGRWPTTLLLAGAIAFLAERAFHHPDLELHYDRVTVRLQTHDAGGITDRDFGLAQEIERMAVGHIWDPSVFEGPPYSWVS